MLIGNPPRRETFLAVAEAALDGATPLSQNGFKVTLAKNSVVRALAQAAGI